MENEQKENRNKRIYARLSEKEFNTFSKKANDLGYKNNFSELIRKFILDETIVTVNPNLLIDELYKLRVEINRMGNNVNQIANYTNFLMNQNYIETEQYKRYSKLQIDFENKVNEVRKKIDKTLYKI